MPHYSFIVNPVAGGGAGTSRFLPVKAALVRLGISCTLVHTQYPGHATELARQALADGCRCVVAAGGDGTVREIAGALTHTEVPLGILPLGTGNDIARALGIPRRPLDALSHLLEGNARAIDTLDVNGALCINAAGFGYDVEVLEQARRYKRRFRGTISYILGAIRALAHLRSWQVRIAIDGEVLEETAVMVTVGNGTSIGGGMRATPQADLSDGLLDLCIIRRCGALPMLACLLHLIGGRHLGLNRVFYRQAESVAIFSEPAALIQLDGEITGRTPVQIRVAPGSLLVVAGRGQ